MNGLVARSRPIVVGTVASPIRGALDIGEALD
jgi:hypothetical protein